MTETARKLLDKIAKWDALWNRNVGLPITRDEAYEIRLALLPNSLRDANARGAS